MVASSVSSNSWKLGFLFVVFIASSAGVKLFDNREDTFAIRVEVNRCPGSAAVNLTGNFVKIAFLRVGTASDGSKADVVLSYTAEIEIPLAQLMIYGATVHVNSKIPANRGCMQNEEKSVCSDITHVAIHTNSHDCMKWDSLTVLTPFNKKFKFDWTKDERQGSCQIKYCDSLICKGEYFNDQRGGHLAVYKRDGMKIVRQQFMMSGVSIHKALEFSLNPKAHPRLDAVQSINERVYDLSKLKKCVYKNPAPAFHVLHEGITTAMKFTGTISNCPGSGFVHAAASVSDRNDPNLSFVRVKSLSVDGGKFDSVLHWPYHYEALSVNMQQLGFMEYGFSNLLHFGKSFEIFNGEHYRLYCNYDNFGRIVKDDWSICNKVTHLAMVVRGDCFHMKRLAVSTAVSKNVTENRPGSASDCTKCDDWICGPDGNTADDRSKSGFAVIYDIYNAKVVRRFNLKPGRPGAMSGEFFHQLQKVARGEETVADPNLDNSKMKGCSCREKKE